MDFGVGNVGVDFIRNGAGGGDIANKLLANNMDTRCLRPYIGNDGNSYMDVLRNGKEIATPVANASLRKDEWKHLDEQIVMSAQRRLKAVNDLMSRGLRYSMPNGMGSTVLEYEDMDDPGTAEVTMDGVTRGKADTQNYELKYLPLPIVFCDFFYNARILASSRTRGASLDTTMGEHAGRKVAEKVEEFLMVGASSFAFGGGTLYGYLDFPYNSDTTLTAHWDDSAATGTTIVNDVRAMKQASINDRHYGPWVLYIPTNFETKMDDDFKAESDVTIRERILKIDGIVDVQVNDFLTADNVVLAEMDSQTVRMVEALPIQTVQWESNGGMRLHFKVMTILVPQIRADQANRSGIVVGTK